MEGDLQKVKDRLSADFSGFVSTTIGYMGDKLGLFKEVSKAPTDSTTLAKTLNLNERYVLEWLKAACAAEYIEHDTAKGIYFMTEAQRRVLADEGGLDFLAPYFSFYGSSGLGLPAVMEKGFVGGSGIAYDELHPDVLPSMRRMHFAPLNVHLVQTWIPSVPGLLERIQTGINVLDVGCGTGVSTLAMARAFPSSKFVGVDVDMSSITNAIMDSEKSGVSNLSYYHGDVNQYIQSTGERFDFILVHDCIHDMVDPVGELKTIKSALKDSLSLVLWSEPSGSSNPNENRNVKGRTRAGISLLHCMTVSLAHGGAGLGTIIGKDGAKKLSDDSGFGHFEVLDIPGFSTQYFYILKL